MAVTSSTDWGLHQQTYWSLEVTQEGVARVSSFWGCEQTLSQNPLLLLGASDSPWLLDGYLHITFPLCVSISVTNFPLCVGRTGCPP